MTSTTNVNAEAHGLSPFKMKPMVVDIEHTPVADDPRKWSSTRKNIVLIIVAAASMIAGLATSIQNPSIEQMEEQLPATSSEISLTMSLFILVQGLMPLVWSAISELKGRKSVYLLSIGTFVCGSIVVALSNSVGLVIGFRCLQGAGSSAVLAIGAGTLADIYDPFERGTKMGIYYIAPMLGPSLGPILGGVLTTGFNWRAAFWFLAIFASLSWFSFLFLFKDTFCRERSLAYRGAIERRLASRLSDSKDEDGLGVQKFGLDHNTLSASHESPFDVSVIRLSLIDVNPLKPLWLVLRRWNNVTILIPSALLFAFSFTISYATSRTLGSAYHYNALRIGFTLLSYGLGCIAGSVLGGRWSDRVLARLKAANEGDSYPEMRLKSTFTGFLLFPASILGYGWASERHVHISVLCVLLFICGFLSIWVYSSTLAYIVDANNGRSSTAVATNSAFRGIGAFIGTETVVPLQDSVGDGWLYTIWTVLMVASGALILLVFWKGGHWRIQGEARERSLSQSQSK